MSYFLRAIRELSSVPTSDYEERVEDICRDLDGETVEEGKWPAEFFPGVMNLLSDKSFLSVRTSWHLLLLIKNNWELLSSADASAFKSILVAAFDNFGDWMGPFVASEMLGKFYPDEDTLTILRKLNKAANMPARELIPHAFETLARTTQNEAVSGFALRELEMLLEDDSGAVRKEAAISLARIANAS
jgi:hypothetical protein